MIGPRKRTQVMAPDVLTELQDLRDKLSSAFGPDTAASGFPKCGPSSGQCAAVAAVVHEVLGGDMLSTHISGHSHWLNRVAMGGHALDIDFTGDQFGFPPIQLSQAGTLYPNTRQRDVTDLSTETLKRALLLSRRAGLSLAECAIETALKTRQSIVPDSSKPD